MENILKNRGLLELLDVPQPFPPPPVFNHHPMLPPPPPPLLNNHPLPQPAGEVVPPPPLLNNHPLPQPAGEVVPPPPFLNNHPLPQPAGEVVPPPPVLNNHPLPQPAGEVVPPPPVLNNHNFNFESLNRELCFICQDMFVRGDYVYIFTPCLHFAHHIERNPINPPTLLPRSAPATEERSCIERFFESLTVEDNLQPTCPTCRGNVTGGFVVIVPDDHVMRVPTFPVRPVLRQPPNIILPSQIRHTLQSVPTEIPLEKICCGSCKQEIGHGVYRVSAIPCEHMFHVACGIDVLFGLFCLECEFEVIFPYITPPHIEDQLHYSSDLHPTAPISIALMETSRTEWAAFWRAEERHIADMVAYEAAILEFENEMERYQEYMAANAHHDAP